MISIFLLGLFLLSLPCCPGPFSCFKTFCARLVHETDRARSLAVGFLLWSFIFPSCSGLSPFQFLSCWWRAFEQKRQGLITDRWPPALVQHWLVSSRCGPFQFFPCPVVGRWEAGVRLQQTRCFAIGAAGGLLSGSPSRDIGSVAVFPLPVNDRLEADIGFQQTRCCPISAAGGMPFGTLLNDIGSVAVFFVPCRRSIN